MNSNSYFNEVANQWDTMRSGFFSEIVREKAYNMVKIEQGKTAADIGAGTGFITEGLAHKGLNVIAVDFSEEMLNQMKEKFKCYNNIDYRQGESENIPIETDTIDYAMANMYLHHVESPSVAIREMARIIKPGGSLILTDLDEHNFEFLKIEHFDRWLGFKREDVKQWFLDAGLKNITVDCVGGNCCTTSCCKNESASISIFIAYGEK
jgi:ubiquinone/menaquinone biosynthesis C-methylase UbiE